MSRRIQARRRRHIVIALACALVLAACGSTANQGTEVAVEGSLAPGSPTSLDGDTAADSPPQTGPGATSDAGPTSASEGGAAPGATTPAGGTAPGPGEAPTVTDGAPAAGTEPIEIGWVLTGVGQADDLGFSFGNTYSERELVDAVAATYNENGGIGGHPIEMVYAKTDTASSSWDADFAAACATFTQDHSVVAVIGYVFTQIDPLEYCLAEKGIPHLSTSYDAPDNAVADQYPLLFNLVQPTQEVRHVAKVDGALDVDVIKPGDRLGVLTEACPGSRRAWTETIKPYIESSGIVISSEAEGSCASGGADANAGAGRVGSVILQFRSADVTHVMAVGRSEIGVAAIALGAESQGWRPTYIVGSGPASMQGFVSDEQLKNFHTFGWDFARDVQSPQWPARTAPQQRCLDLFAAKNIVPQSGTDESFFINACEPFFLYEAALAATGGNTEGYAVGAAIEGMGTSHRSAMLLETRSRFGPGDHQGPVIYRYSNWDDGCSCFVYRSQTWEFP